MSRLAKHAPSAQLPTGVTIPGVHRLTEASLTALGLILILVGLAANQGWWDRHFLPIFSFQRATLAGETAVRGLSVLAGVAVSVILRKRVALVLSRTSVSTVLRVLLAVVLALLAGELILRAYPAYPHDADALAREPRRQADPRLGWTFVPARSVEVQEGGRSVPYSFDTAGYRVRSPTSDVDVERPTLVFTGESIISGFGLSWEETIPARVEALLGIQSANMAVSDYSNDQSYLRLAAELPRFRRPLAVVTLFMPSLFYKNLLHNRPYLSATGVWHRRESRWRLVELLDWLVPYRSNAAIERGIAQTRDSLRALVRLAVARGARPLIVVPQFGSETTTEKMLRERVLDEAGLPYVHVVLDPSWHLKGDLHPDPRAARAIATAIARRLQHDDGALPRRYRP